jgi:glycosyltransferase involved in cell wall biosynthesis
MEIEGIPVRSYGPIATDEELISLYRAADLFVLPSLQENLPNTVMEAMACGTPCAAFDVGGVSDLISHRENGFVARVSNERELAEGITWLMADSDRCAILGCEARKTIESGFDIGLVSERYLKLYDHAIAGHRQSRVLE